jgi:hypothetical protein
MSVPISTAFYERNELVTTESTARRSDAERNVERYRVLSTHKHELSEERESDVIRSYVIDVIERGQASGEFTRDVPSGVLADMLKGMMMAACTEGDAVTAGRLVARVLVHGLDPDPSA